MLKIIHHHFESIDSTNTWAKEHAQEFEDNAITLVTASGQTSGRGRFNRRWESPNHVNVYATFCFFWNQSYSEIGYVPQLLALSAAQVLESLNFQPSLKWPNDVLLSGKKVAGILCETVGVKEKLCIICGIGLNVNMPLEDLQKIDRPATSLIVEGKKYYEVKVILKMIKNQFIKNLESFITNGFKIFFELFKNRSALKPGQKISFHDNQKIIEGYFDRLNEDGSVTIQFINGKIQNFYAGEFLTN